MFLLLLSVAALAFGPALTALLPRTSLAHDLLDGLVLVSLFGLVAVHVLPHTVVVAGWPAALMAVGGFLFPFVLERLAPRADGAPRHAFLVPLVMGAFGVHAFIDGAALVDHTEDAGPANVLALAIVLHRLPDGLAIWSVVRPSRGVRIATGVLAGLGMLTVLGFIVGGRVLEGTSGKWIALLQSFVAGSVLHIIAHRPHAHEAAEHGHHEHHHHEEDRDHHEAHHAHEHSHGHAHDHGAASSGWASTAGALLGLALLVVVTRTHPIVRRETGELGAATAFLSLALEAAPALLASVFVSALVHAFMPHGSRGWLARGGSLSQAMRGILLAPALPQCSCGAVPLYRTLIAKGTPVAAALALLVATPELGVPALLVSMTLLGVRMTLARIAATIIVALIAATAVARLARRAPATLPASIPPPPEQPSKRILAGLHGALEDVVDHAGPWLVLGLAVGALFEPLTRGGALSAVPRWAQVPVLAGAGMPLYVCASGATPLVAILMHKGLSPGAAVAFLVTGPASNVTTFGVIARLHGRLAAASYVGVITIVAVALGYALDIGFAAVTAPSLHEAAEGTAYTWWNVASLVVVGALFMRSVLRRGPRAWFGAVLSTARP